MPAIDWYREWRAFQRIQKREMGARYQGNRDEYRLLRLKGATALHALDALIALEPEWLKPAVIVEILPPGLGRETLGKLLRLHRIHPLSVATHFQDRRKALAFLQRCGMGKFATWLGPSGQLLVCDPLVERLPDRLVLRGQVQIRNCPALVALGSRLTVVAGNLQIHACANLTALPDWLQTRPIRGWDINPINASKRFFSAFGNVELIDCPKMSYLGKKTIIRGQLIVKNCPLLKT